MPGVSAVEHAMVLAARVRTVFEEPFEVEGIDLDVEASVGVAMMEADFATTLSPRRRSDVRGETPGPGRVPVRPVGGP